MILLSFTTDTGFNKKRYFAALPFIEAVYKPENIVDLVHGHTDVLKPGVNTVPASARAARVTSPVASDSSSSSASNSDESSSASNSSEEEATVAKPPIVGRMGRA